MILLTTCFGLLIQYMYQLASETRQKAYRIIGPSECISFLTNGRIKFISDSKESQSVLHSNLLEYKSYIYY